ncbi:UbiA family prenyltransferase [Streptomyces sp. NBC_01465]|uniref:UbiA family prenyltransferase n=1 Tax=Streptomyces sp. NBC_01465 TaxID=2903878 RepID=UPI002E302FA7|nr:UbiA family prenyltransferase [Streptomyces sp. NBC_01465]
MADISSAILIPQTPTRIRLRPRHARLALLEARPVVQVVFLMRYVIGVAASSAHHLLAHPVRLVAGVISWWLAVVAAYLINGVMDVKEDRANGSDRPIARGDLPERVAALLTGGAAVGALALAAFVPGLLVWVAAFLLLGWVYSAPPLPAKRWSTACAVVVFGLGWTSFAGGAATTGGRLSTAGLVFATVMSAWMALVGSVVKDLSDVDGDATGGRRTVAVRYGAHLARALGATGALLVGVGAVLSWLLWAPYMLPAMAPVAIGAVCVVVQIVRTTRIAGGDRRMRRGAYRVFMRTQYAANIAMLFVLAFHGAA